GDLHELAIAAAHERERKPLFGLRRLLGAQIAVGERLLAERQDGCQLGAGAAATHHGAHVVPSSSARYHLCVCARPSSRLKRGRQPSCWRAFFESRNCSRISLLASLRTTGSRSVRPATRRMRPASSRTVSGSSFEKLKASPASSRRSASTSAVRR